jgi:hypothetical protein
MKTSILPVFSLFRSTTVCLGQREDLAIAVLISGACGFFGFAGFLQVIIFGLPLCGDTAMA